MSDILIMDTGAHSVKVGRGSDPKPHRFPNYIFRPKHSNRLLVSDEIYGHRDQTSLFYLSPKQNGYTLNWDVQRTVWAQLKIVYFWQKKMHFLTQICIFDKILTNFYFWLKIVLLTTFLFLTKISIFHQNIYFRQKILFLTKFFYFWQIFVFLTKIYIFDKQMYFWHKFVFWTKK